MNNEHERKLIKTALRSRVELSDIMSLYQLKALQYANKEGHYQPSKANYERSLNVLVNYIERRIK